MKTKWKKYIESYGIIHGSFCFLKYLCISFFKVAVASSLNRIFGIKNIIVLKGQSDFEGNCRKLYDELIEAGLDKTYKIVWHIDNVENKSNLKNDHTVIITNDNFFKSIYYNAVAKYVFFEVACCFKRRVKGQTIVYLSHGCPSIKNSLGLVTLNPKLVSYAVVTSESVSEKMAEIYEFPQSKLIINGLLRNDAIFKDNISFDVVDKTITNRVIIWMPTFRKTNIIVNNISRSDSEEDYLFGLPLIKSMDDLEAINKKLIQENITLVIKPHPRAAECGIETINFSNIKVWTNEFLNTNGVNIYSLFHASSGMVTDYSSVSFDYLLADHPIAYVIDDINSYKLGFAYDNILEYMPGNHISNREELFMFFEQVARSQDLYYEKRHQINKWANKYQDGNNSQRMIKMLGM